MPNDCGAAQHYRRATSLRTRTSRRGPRRARTPGRLLASACGRGVRVPCMHLRRSALPYWPARGVARARAGRRRRSRRHMGGFGEEGDAAAPAVRDGGTGMAGEHSGRCMACRVSGRAGDHGHAMSVRVGCHYECDVCVRCSCGSSCGCGCSGAEPYCLAFAVADRSRLELGESDHAVRCRVRGTEA